MFQSAPRKSCDRWGLEVDRSAMSDRQEMKLTSCASSPCGTWANTHDVLAPRAAKSTRQARPCQRMPRSAVTHEALTRAAIALEPPPGWWRSNRWPEFSSQASRPTSYCTGCWSNSAKKMMCQGVCSARRHARKVCSARSEPNWHFTFATTTLSESGGTRHGIVA